MKLTVKQSRDLVGGLSYPSKMPSVGYSLPARACRVGAELAKIKGTVCFGCYALRGNYQFPHVQRALERRLTSIENPYWVDAMATLIHHRLDLHNRAVLTGKKPRYDGRFFRWHDSGDLQSVAHLEKIAEIARRCPAVTFWLPTREYQIVEQYCQREQVPTNLVIRLSAHKIDGPLPVALAQRYGLTVSGVHTAAPSSARACPAQSQGNKCLDCRACWSRDAFAISYHKH